MDAMKKLFLFLWMMVILLPLGAQEQYISKGRYTPEDRFEDLGGGGGILYGAQNEAYMSRSAEKWVRDLCFNELGVCG